MNAPEALSKKSLIVFGYIKFFKEANQKIGSQKGNTYTTHKIV